MQYLSPSRLALSLSALLASNQLLAAGFAINEQSASAMGTAFAGRSSSALDASTVYGNPAGMSYLDEQVSGGMALISAGTDIDDVNSNYRGSNDGDMVPLTAIPFGYYVKPLDEQWSFGLGVFVPYGLATNYENNYQGRRFAKDSEVAAVAIQPTLSYRINEQWSLGAGVSANHIEGKLSSAVDPFALPSSEGEFKVEGDDWGWAYTVGLMFQATDATRIGLTYRSKVEYTLDGDATNSRIGLGPLGSVAAGKYDASLDLTTPENFELSVTHQFDSHWTGYAGYIWTRWSRFKEVVIESPANASGLFHEVTEEQNWHNTRSFAAGLSYQLDKEWVLRSGVAFDPTPTNNTNRSPRIPSGDRYVWALGAGYTPASQPNLTLDLAYVYLQEEQVSIHKQEFGKGTYNADYNNNGHALAAQATWRF